MSKALNDVYFGDFRMSTNVAKFDMFEKYDKNGKGVVEGVKGISGEEEKSKRAGEGVAKLLVVLRKEELEKVKAEAMCKEREREKKREGGKEGGSIKVKVGWLEVPIQLKKGKEEEVAGELLGEGLSLNAGGNGEN